MNIALVDALDLAGWGHPKRLPVTFVIASAPFIAVYFLYPDTTEATKEIMIALYGLAGLGMIAAVLLLVTIVATPPRLARESEKAAAAERSALSEQVDTLARKLDQSASRREMDSAIDAIIEGGNKVCVLLKQSTKWGSPELEAAFAQAKKWLSETEKFVTINYPDSVGWYKSDAGLVGYAMLPGPVERAVCYSNVEHRMIRIREIASRSLT